MLVFLIHVCGGFAAMRAVGLVVGQQLVIVLAVFIRAETVFNNTPAASRAIRFVLYVFGFTKWTNINLASSPL